jgi:hypothetical protein
MLHIASYQHYSLVEIHLYQSYFNISCYSHEHLLVSSVMFGYYIVQEIVNKETNVIAKCENGKMLLH